MALGLNTHRVPLIANPNRCCAKAYTVVSKERIQNADIVYCLTELKNHSVVANGIMTGQCGELPLPSGGACLLGSMNLAEYVINQPGKSPEFDFKEFGNDVMIAIRALDVVQDEGIPRHPLDIQQQTAKDWKQLGLGIMGLGDMLIKMNIPYGSDKSLELCSKIGNLLAKASIIESSRLGEEKGSFPKFDALKTMNSEFMKAHFVFNEPLKSMRNSQLLAIAPTGTISTMLGVSGGIEPLFALEYNRITKSLHGKDKTYKVVPKVVEEAREMGYTDGLVCANDIDFKNRVEMQSVWQKHIDGSISSTINLSNDFPKEKIAELYLNAWKFGLKGVTVFRDGCKREGILKSKPKTDVVQPEELIGYKRKVITGCGPLWLNIFCDSNGDVKCTFCVKGSKGGCEKNLIGLSRMIALSLKNNVPLDEIIDQLDSCGVCPSFATQRAKGVNVSPGSSCPSTIANVLKEFVNTKKSGVKGNTSEKCPECGGELVSTGGCKSCAYGCGYSRCG